MVSVVVLFWMFVVLFAVIGAMRGWAKELLVTFSAILALFIIDVFERFIPFIKGLSPTMLFWFRMIILLSLVFFGYQTPNITRFANARFARERLQDTLLGLFLGALNGYLIAGTIWYYMNQAGYPFPNFISAPPPGTALYNTTQQMMAVMPPVIFSPTSAAIYFAVALAFAFVLIVFI